MEIIPPNVNIQPPLDYRGVTLADLLGVDHEEKLQDAAKRVLRKFEKIRGKMDMYRTFRGL